MKFEFDHTHYVPILRLKRAERVALMKLTNPVRSRITPLLELVVTKENSPLTISDNLRRQWGPSPFFVDDVNWPGSESGKIIVSMVNAMRSHGLLAIPVTGLDRSQRQQVAVAKIAAEDNRGACIRLCPADLNNSSLEKKLSGLLSLLGLQPAQVDLIVDYRVLADFALPYNRLSERLPHLLRWRTFTVASGAFGPDLQEYTKNAQYKRPREDWLFWKDEISTPDLKRRPTYSDYTIQYGYFKEPPKRSSPSTSIRYAAPEYWVIMRGEGLKTGPGFVQYAAHAKLLCQRNEYRGEKFSDGDLYIDRLRNGLDGTGNLETVLRAGINHHITLTVTQISNLFGTSIDGVPSREASPKATARRGGHKPGRAAYDGTDQLHRTHPID
jgi:T4 beta protein